MGKITVGELKQKLIVRVFFESSRTQKLTDEKFAKAIQFHLKDILKEVGFENVIVRKIRNKIFLIYTPNGRIICQIGIDGREIYFVNLKGVISDSSSFDELVEIISKLSARLKKG